jgi:type II secretory pathway pseudopilin PulG
MIESPGIIRIRRRAFTYIELLALLAIAAILLAIFIPFLENYREISRRGRCADNLRRLRDALDAYAKENQTQYPRTLYEPAVNRFGYSAFTGADSPNPFTLAVGPSDVSASLWLLVRGQFITDLSVFICPSSSGVPDKLTDFLGQPVPATRRSNFRSSINLSYSYASPFSGCGPEDYRFTSDAFSGQFALMADKNPGRAATIPAHNAQPLELAKGNSLNHARAGQNVLYADGSVYFETTPYCGVGFDAEKKLPGDNIYTALAPYPLPPGNSPYYANNGFCGRQYGPSYQYDSYLVPTEEDGK